MARTTPAVVLAMFLPLSLFAQDDRSSPQKHDAAAATMEETTSSPSTVTPALSLDLGTPTTSLSALGQRSKTPSQQKPKPGKPSTSSSEDRPPIEGSMVGYIDNAIIGSQLRLRFDAGFDDNRPDRAEFFYAQCGCDGPPAQGPQGLVLHLNFQQVYMRGEYAPARRFSVFFEVPVRWVQPQQFVTSTGSFTNQAGISDVQAGFKFALFASRERYLTFQFRTSFPSGDSLKGLGTNHYSVEPSVLYYQRLTDRWSFEGQLGVWHPLDGKTPGFPGDVFTYGIGPSYELYRGENVRFAPVMELVGWRVLGGKETSGDVLVQQRAAGVPAANLNPVINSEGTNIVNLKIGARTSIGSHNSFYVGYGQALTHELWYKHLVRLEYRYTF
jgi:hypothetical protein